MTKEKGEAPTVGAVDASRSQSPCQDEQPQAVPGGLRLRRPTLYPAELRVQRVADANVAPTPDVVAEKQIATCLANGGHTLTCGCPERVSPELLERFLVRGDPAFNPRAVAIADRLDGGRRLQLSEYHAARDGAALALEHVEDLEGALEDVLEAWDRYQEVLGDCEDKPIQDAEADLEAELEGARIVLQALQARGGR